MLILPIMVIALLPIGMNSASTGSNRSNYMWDNNGKVYQIRLVHYIKSQQWVIVNYAILQQHSAYENLRDARQTCNDLNKWNKRSKEYTYLRTV